MNIFNYLAGLLTSALSLLGLVQSNPMLPPSQHDQSVQRMQQVVSTTDHANAESSTTVQSGEIRALPTTAKDLWTIIVGGDPHKIDSGTVFELDLGDGSTEWLKCKSKTYSPEGARCEQFAPISHRYQATGSYTVRALANRAGAREFAKTTIFVEVAPKSTDAHGSDGFLATRIFRASRSYGPAPLSISFFGGLNGDVIVFGDGTSGVFGMTSCPTDGSCYPSASHKYNLAGTYRASLVRTGATVTIKVDNSGSEETGTLEIEHANQPLMASFRIHTIQSHAYVLEFGDGTNSSIATGCSVCSAEHTYAEPGTYEATLKMDGKVTATATVRVGN